MTGDAPSPKLVAEHIKVQPAMATTLANNSVQQWPYAPIKTHSTSQTWLYLRNNITPLQQQSQNHARTQDAHPHIVHTGNHSVSPEIELQAAVHIAVCQRPQSCSHCMSQRATLNDTQLLLRPYPKPLVLASQYGVLAICCDFIGCDSQKPTDACVNQHSTKHRQEMQPKTTVYMQCNDVGLTQEPPAPTA